MTLKEMFKKINTYNEIAEAIGTRKQIIEISERPRDINVTMFSFKGTDFKAFKKALTDEYIEESVNLILNYDGYEFDRDVELDNSIISVYVLGM